MTAASDHIKIQSWVENQGDVTVDRDVFLNAFHHQLPFYVRIRVASAVLRELDRFTPRRQGWTAEELLAHSDVRSRVDDMKNDLRSFDGAASYAVDLVAQRLIDAGWRKQ